MMLALGNECIEAKPSLCAQMVRFSKFRKNDTQNNPNATKSFPSFEATKDCNYCE